jgi:hypothetical protein
LPLDIGFGLQALSPMNLEGMPDHFFASRVPGLLLPKRFVFR